MMTIDHETFHAMEIDGLYEELDAPGATALNAHAASCDSCGPRFERLQRARQRGLAALSEQVSATFESRVMAAVDAALAARVLPSNVVAFPSRAPNAPPANAPRAKVVPIFARPWFAAAASLFLIIGAATILSQTAMKKGAPSAASMADNAPAASMPAGQAAEAPAELAGIATAPPPAVVALDTPAASADSDNVLALNDKAKFGNAAPAPHAVARASKPTAAEPPPAMAAAVAPASPAAGAAAATGSGNDITLASAKQLYAAGRYRDALAKFEALASGSPEADLYAARCIQRTSGCTAAAPRFDAVASRYAGSGIGRAATNEGNACYAMLGTTPPSAGPGANVRASPKKAAAPPAATATATVAPANADSLQ